MVLLKRLTKDLKDVYTVEFYITVWLAHRPNMKLCQVENFYIYYVRHCDHVILVYPPGIQCRINS